MDDNERNSTATILNTPPQSEGLSEYKTTADDDEELSRLALLEKLESSVYPNDYLRRMLEDKDGPLITPYFQKLVCDEESPELKKFEEDSRIDYLLRMKNALNERFENSAHIHPHGMTTYDYECIPKSRRKGLEHFKMKMRRENYMYLSVHSDIDAMISLFLQKVIKVQPAEPVKFAGEFFTLRGTTHLEFIRMLEEEKKRLRRYHTQRTYFQQSPLQTHEPNFGYGGNSAWIPKRLDQANQVKKLGLGALASIFQTTPQPSRHLLTDKPSQSSVQDEAAASDEEEVSKKFYCGCKDPGRREKSHLYQKRKEEYTTEEEEFSDIAE